MQRSFKNKTIEKIISSKVDYWIKSITDETIHDEILDNYIVTGGAITSLLLGEKPNDFDIYFSNPQTAKKVADYYLSKLIPSNKVSKIYSVIENDRVAIVIKSSGVTPDENPGDGYKYFEHSRSDAIEQYLDKDKTEEQKKVKFGIQLITTNAITLNDEIQIIIRFTGEASVIHKNYDFIHVTNYYTKKEGLVLNLDAVRSVMTKELRYIGSLYPLCSMFRIRKFIKRGWTISAGQMLKIGYDISTLDLSNPRILKEQLVGVDVAYFNELLNILKTENRNLDRIYLAELIERVFDTGDCSISEKEKEVLND